MMNNVDVIMLRDLRDVRIEIGDEDLLNESDLNDFKLSSKILDPLAARLKSKRYQLNEYTSYAVTTENSTTTNFAILPNQYFAIAAKLFDFAKEIRKYFDLFDQVRGFGEKFINVSPLGIEKIIRDNEVLLAVFEDQRDIPLFSQFIENNEKVNEYRLGGKKLFNDKGVPRGSADCFASIILKVINVANMSSSILGELIYDLTSHLDLYEDLELYYESEKNTLGNKQCSPFNKIIYGAPGTGKTYHLQNKYLEGYLGESDTMSETGSLETVEDVRSQDYELNARQGTAKQAIKRYEFVTFHQSFSYEEFVEGIRPTLDSGSSESKLTYTLKDGVFKELCTRAALDPENSYAIFIDEINRGNVSKIFGELITLIEPNKRLGMENELRVTLPYSGDSFGVPKNLDIYGTMNTADRSLTSLDTALRRRFTFEELRPDPTLLKVLNFKGQEINLPAMLTIINRRIEALIDREHVLGHSNFMGMDGEDLPAVFKNKIIPQLQDFFFDDWRKIRLVLADNMSQEESNQFVIQMAFPNDLFGDDSEYIRDRDVYELNKSALFNPDSYLKIYEEAFVNEG